MLYIIPTGYYYYYKGPEKYVQTVFRFEILNLERGISTPRAAVLLQSTYA